MLNSKSMPALAPSTPAPPERACDSAGAAANVRVPAVTVIVLNWNGRDDTIACVESLAHVEYANFQVMVVDNGSTDGSVAALRARFPELEIVETGRNLGFAEGNNVGVRLALQRGADYAFLLNNDTEVDPSLLRELVAAAERCPEGGIFAAKIFYHADPARLWYAGAVWNDRKMGFEHLHEEGKLKADARGVAATDYACGCALLARSSMLREVGLLDSKFFLTYEETDLCFRARRAGFSCYYVPGAILWHKISASFGGAESPLIKYFLTRNRLLWGERYLPFRELMLLYKVSWWELRAAMIPKSAAASAPAGAIPRLRGLLRTVALQWKDPYNQAMAWGILHYALRRFGDAPRYVRALARRKA
jgi:GT2 family glycosyltransferase